MPTTTRARARELLRDGRSVRPRPCGPGGVMLHYSCDSHVVEPREVFSGLETRFGSRAPQVVTGWKDRPGDFVLLPGAPPIPVGRFGIAGHRLDDPATND